MSSSKKDRGAQQEKKERLSLRIKPELKEQMQGYCERRGTSMSQLVTQHFISLLEDEGKAVDADSF